MSALANSPLIDLVTRMVRGWTVLYTWQLPEDVRESRRAEIESDLWEHRHLAMLVDEPSYQTAMGIFLRFLFGLPADLAWRVETGSFHRSADTGAGSADAGLFRWVIRGAYALIGLPALSGLYGVTVATISGEFIYLMFAMMTLVMVGAAIVGLRMSATRQPLGILLVAGGSLGFVIAWSMWYPVYITLPASIGLIGVSYFRGRSNGDDPAMDSNARDGSVADKRADGRAPAKEIEDPMSSRGNGILDPDAGRLPGILMLVGIVVFLGTVFAPTVLWDFFDAETTDQKIAVIEGARTEWSIVQAMLAVGAAFLGIGLWYLTSALREMVVDEHRQKIALGAGALCLVAQASYALTSVFNIVASPSTVAEGPTSGEAPPIFYVYVITLLVALSGIAFILMRSNHRRWMAVLLAVIAVLHFLQLVLTGDIVPLTIYLLLMPIAISLIARPLGQRHVAVAVAAA